MVLGLVCCGCGCGCGCGCELIHLVWRCCRPLPPLRRVPFVLAKGTKTACSCIRPYAALRVPSLRHLPGPRGLRLASPSLRLALFGYAEGATHWPLQAPPLSLLKSQSAAPELARMKVKVAYSPQSWGKPAPTGRPINPVGAGLPHDCISLATSVSGFEDTPVQAPPVTLQLQKAERRCLEGAGSIATPNGSTHSLNIQTQSPPMPRQ
ncbi:hypothetical protein ACVI9W_004608 [Pseudomonas sp. 210_17 TE3656]